MRFMLETVAFAVGVCIGLLLLNTPRPAPVSEPCHCKVQIRQAAAGDKRWEVKYEYKSVTDMVEVSAQTWNDAAEKVKRKYPGCKIESVTEVR